MFQVCSAIPVFRELLINIIESQVCCTIPEPIACCQKINHITPTNYIGIPRECPFPNLENSNEFNHHVAQILGAHHHKINSYNKNKEIIDFNRVTIKCRMG